MSRFWFITLYRSLVRHKLYLALNVCGLAAGIAVFCVLGLYVRFETSFEQWLPRYDEIYLVETKLHLPGSPFNGAYPVTMGGLLEQMREDFPGVRGARLRGGRNGGSVLQGAPAIVEDVAQVDPSFVSMFGLKMVEGDGRRALRTPSAVLISRSAARKYFGASNPLGRTMTIAMDAPASYRVAGVFEDLPANTELRFSILIPLPKVPPPGDWSWYHWGSASVSTWLRFASPADARAFARKLPAFVDRHARGDMGPDASKFFSLQLLPIASVHLQPAGPESARRKLVLATLGLVGLLTLLMAIVNYVNLATAWAGLRAREVAMRKVLGADRGMLVRQFLVEAILTTAIAALVGLTVAELGLPWVNAAGGLSLSIPYGWMIPLLAALTLVTGIVAGFYPALLLSRFPASVALAAAHAPGGGRAGARLRELLVVLQFGLATAFIIATVVIALQMRHVGAADLGFQRDGLITVGSLADRRLPPDRAQALLAAFRDLPGVTKVGVGRAGPGDAGGSHIDVIETPGGAVAGGGPSVRVLEVGPGFFTAYGARLLAGRYFDDAHGADDATDRDGWSRAQNIIIDRQAVALLGFRSPEQAIGKTVGSPRPRTIIGVIDNMRFFSSHSPGNATYYVYYRDLPPGPVAAIRYSGNPRAMLSTLRSTWSRMAPQIPFDADTANHRLAGLYKADDHALHLVGIGTALAVLISCLGLWGLASFNAARRVKEIGIRKVLGASSADIVKLMTGAFLRPVLLANLIAWPFAFLAARMWLAGFDDRIALSPLHFLFGSLIAAAIAILTVAGQSFHASRLSPAEALRHE